MLTKTSGFHRPKPLERVSPLKDIPLRTAGQSVDRQLSEVILDEILLPGVIVLMLVVFVALEWWRWYRPEPPQPLIMTSIAALVSGFAILKVMHGWKRAHAFK